MCFIVSEQALELLRQFSRWGKEEGENWRQRSRNPSVPVEYLCISPVNIELLFFHLDRLSLHTLSCLWLFAHTLRQCLTDTSSVFVTLFVGLRQLGSF